MKSSLFNSRSSSNEKWNAKSKMAIGIDTSKWKPRKLNGTPAAKFATLLGCGVLGVGIAFGVFFQYNNITKNLRKAFDDFYEDPIEEVERRIMIASGLPNRSGDTIREIIKEYERLDKPHN